MRVLVTGGGIAGLSVALALGRAGHDVTVIERDEWTSWADAASAFGSHRRGIAHFQQPHAFLPRGRAEMRALFPDVYAALLAAGASEDIDVSRKLRGPRAPEDVDLVYLSVRRPVIEWALRTAVARERSIDVRGGIKMAGLVFDHDCAPRVTGIRTDRGDTIMGDLVVDAQGRTTSVPQALTAAGVRPAEDRSPTHVVYYSRYYRWRPGRSLPDGPWLTTPRGDLGYAGFSTFTGDNGTFAIVLAIGSWDRDLRVLQHEAAYDALCRSIPVLEGLISPDVSEPISAVLPMGEMHNSLRRYVADDRPIVRGLLPAGDAVCHTDPTFALGLSFCLIHARHLAGAVESQAHDLDALALDYWARTAPEMHERYDMVTAADAARARTWHGERLDFTRADGCYPLFALVGATVAALRDDVVLRTVARRMGFLDRTAVFDDDTALHARIQAILAPMMEGAPPATPGPSRSQLLEIVHAAMGQRGRSPNRRLSAGESG